jgi:hypothetical protein
MTTEAAKHIGHYYRPIPFYAGKVLKYGGIATPGNAWVLDEKPGTIILDRYIADRITADTHEDFGNNI